MSVAADPTAPQDASRRAAEELVTTLPPAPAVWCSGLAKRYGRRQAVQSVSFEVGRGQVVGLLGPNGAGSRWRCWRDRSAARRSCSASGWGW